jgi:hypothetical protein
MPVTTKDTMDTKDQSYRFFLRIRRVRCLANLMEQDLSLMSCTLGRRSNDRASHTGFTSVSLVSLVVNDLPRPIARPRTYYVSFEIKSKIGMYIAMTMPPTTTPRIAIMIGSSSVSRPATAVSTSSS